MRESLSCPPLNGFSLFERLSPSKHSIRPHVLSMRDFASHFRESRMSHLANTCLSIPSVSVVRFQMYSSLFERSIHQSVHTRSVD